MFIKVFLFLSVCVILLDFAGSSRWDKIYFNGSLKSYLKEEQAKEIMHHRKIGIYFPISNGTGQIYLYIIIKISIKKRLKLKKKSMAVSTFVSCL